MTTRILVDFNRREPGGVVPAEMGDADALVEVGEAILAYDGDENLCTGVVVNTDGRFLLLAMDWSTFAAAKIDTDHLVGA